MNARNKRLHQTQRLTSLANNPEANNTGQFSSGVLQKLLQTWIIWQCIRVVLIVSIYVISLFSLTVNTFHCCHEKQFPSETVLNYSVHSDGGERMLRLLVSLDSLSKFNRRCGYVTLVLLGGLTKVCSVTSGIVPLLPRLTSPTR